MFVNHGPTPANLVFITSNPHVRHGVAEILTVRVSRTVAGSPQPIQVTPRRNSSS